MINLQSRKQALVLLRQDLDNQTLNNDCFCTSPKDDISLADGLVSDVYSGGRPIFGLITLTMTS